MLEYLIETPDEATADAVVLAFSRRGFIVERLEPTLVKATFVFKKEVKNYA